MSVIMPGSYDPVPLGHLDVIRRVAEKHDEVYVVIFTNPNKEYTFSLEDRVRMLILATEDIPNVTVSYSLGRVVDYMREHGISRIVKGYRSEEDLPWEREQAEYNLLHGGYETDLIKSSEEYRGISSTLARRALLLGEDTSDILPSAVREYIEGLGR